MSPTRRVALAITGASGAQYGLRLLEQLVVSGVEVGVMLSQPARVVIGTETDFALPGRVSEAERYLADRFGARRGQLEVYGEQQWTAPVASGSSVFDACVVCPCTTGTLAAVATGQSRTLIERAVDVTLKERKRLILVVRETPFSEIHLENMLRLARMGAVIMPANPGFYHRPDTIDQLIDFMVARILDHLGIAHALLPRWGDRDRVAAE